MSDARVLLVNTNQMRPPIAPIGLDYLADALREQGFEADLLGLCFVDDCQSAIAEYFAEHCVLAVAVTLRNTDDTYFASQDFFVPRVKAIVDLLRDHTSAPLILGGVGFSVMPQAVMSYCQVDLGLWGEGEYSLPALVSRLVTGQEPFDVPGLIYRQGTGYRRNPAISLDLARLRTPSRDTVDNRRYFAEGGQGNIESKRGCNGRCIYCADPVAKGRRVRLRSPASVAEEVEKLVSQGIDQLHFCDSEFNLPEAHAREVCLALIEWGMGDRVRWYAYVTPAPFSDELALLMRRAGCIGVNFGADSGTDAMLQRLGRDFRVDVLQRTADICHRQGLVFMYDLLLGGPGETKESLQSTIELMKRLSPHRVGASLGVRLYPGTRLAAMVRKEGPLGQNGNLWGSVANNNNFLAPVFYVSSALGDEAQEYLAELIGNDERFFVGLRGEENQNYNYNDNSFLVNAINRGYRGAYWDILRRLQQGGEAPEIPLSV